MILCKSVISLPSQESILNTAKQWSSWDVKLYIKDLSLFMAAEEHDETSSHPALLLSYKCFPEQWVCLFHKDHFCAAEYTWKTESPNHDQEMHEFGVDEQSLQLTLILNNRRAMRWGQESLWVQVCCLLKLPWQGWAGERSLSAAAGTFPPVT